MIRIPEPNPDELLVGYIGRVSRLNQVSRADVWQSLHAKSNTTAWPGKLKTWTLPLAEVLGLSVVDVLTAHTLEPFIRVHCRPVAHSKCLLPDFDRLSAIQQTEMAVPSHQLRLCEACVHEDIGFWGYSYWRRSHQLPGIRWCMKHLCGLVEESDPSAKDRFPEECGTGVRSHLLYLWSSPVVRYAEICASLLEMKDRNPVQQARFRLRRRAAALGLRLSIDGVRTTVSDKVMEQFSVRWLSASIPTIRTKVTGKHFPIIDNVCRNGTNPASGATYALVLASLYGDADEALRDVSRALTEAEAAEAADMSSPRLSGARGGLLRRHARQQPPNATTDAQTRAANAHLPWPFSESQAATIDD